VNNLEVDEVVVFAVHPDLRDGPFDVPEGRLPVGSAVFVRLGEGDPLSNEWCEAFRLERRLVVFDVGFDSSCDAVEFVLAHRSSPLDGDNITCLPVLNRSRGTFIFRVLRRRLLRQSL